MNLANNTGRRFTPSAAHMRPEKYAFDFGDIETQEHLCKVTTSIKGDSKEHKED